MHTAPSQVKRAAQAENPWVITGLGKWIQGVMRDRMGDRPLTSVYNEQAKALPTSDPQRQLYDKLIRERQSQAGGQLTDWAQYGLLAGGALGLAKGLPKLLRTREALKDPPGMSEEEAIDLEKSSVFEGAPGVIDALATGAKNVAGKITDVLGSNLYGSVPEHPANIQGPGGLPPGSLWPLYAGIPLATGMAAYGLTDSLANTTREHMIMRRKRTLQKKFEDIIAGRHKTASSRFVDKLATSYEKRAVDEGAKATGMLALLAAGLAAVGGIGGYRMAKMYSPGAVKTKALEDALRRKNVNRPLAIHIEPSTAATAQYAEPEPVSALERDEFTLPMAMPANKYASVLMPRYSNGIGKSAAVDTMTSNAGGMLHNAGEALGGAYDSAVGGTINAAKRLAQPFKPALKTLAGQAGNWTKKYVSEPAGTAGGVSAANTFTAKPETQKLMQTAQTGLEQIAPAAKSVQTAAKGVTDLTDKAKPVVEQVGQAGKFMTDLGGGAKEMWGQAKEYLGPIIQQLMAGAQGMMPQQPEAAPSQVPAPIAAGDAADITQPKVTVAPPAAQPEAPVTAPPTTAAAAVPAYTGDTAVSKVESGDAASMLVKK